MICDTLAQAWDSGIPGQALVRFVAGANLAAYCVDNIAQVCKRLEFGDIPSSDHPQVEQFIQSLVTDQGASARTAAGNTTYYSFMCQGEAQDYLAGQGEQHTPIMQPAVAGVCVRLF
ncbi:MAG: hypothetical protein KJ601_03640 [Nanoarchaeota archaeon]|nr:hypothetical protein [Nanoarchaeota archaeon]MBU1704902.1 hypothetical protein [Nanoarchaeota archaeon]